MEFTYKTKGVCAYAIKIEIDGDRVGNVTFNGGCDGNHKGIAQLVKGMKIDDVIERLQFIKCGGRNTSCPAQLAEALKEYQSEKGE